MNGVNEKWIWKNGEEDRLSADTVEELIEIVNNYKQVVTRLREARKKNEKIFVTKYGVNLLHAKHPNISLQRTRLLWLKVFPR